MSPISSNLPFGWHVGSLWVGYVELWCHKLAPEDLSLIYQVIQA